jgi:MATE family multidrug resistance protein
MNSIDSNAAHRAARRAELRHVIAMSIPVVVTTSSRALMDVADFVMIKWMHIPEAQAAILPSQMMMWSYLVLGMGVVSLVTTFTAQCLGGGREKECGGYAWQSIYIAALFGLLATAAVPYVPALVAWIGHDPAVQALEIAYTKVALLTAGPTIAAGGLGWYFIGIHRPYVTMWSVLEANVVNVVVSYVLIFGLFGFEAMGIAGAAWGTLVAVSYRTVRLALALCTPSMEARFASRSGWRPDLRKLANLLRVGLPCGVQWLSEVLVWALFVNVLVGRRFGTSDLIATNTVWQYMRVAFMPTIGVGQSLTSLVGRSIGAGDHARAIRETRIGLGITFAYMGMLSVIYALYGGRLVGWFNNDPEVVRIGAVVMLFAAVFQLFDSVGITYNAALRGAGDTLWASVLFIVGSWVIIIGGGLTVTALAPQWGSIGPWATSSSCIIFTAIMLWWRWHGRRWMRIDLLGSGGAPAPVVAGESSLGAVNGAEPNGANSAVSRDQPVCHRSVSSAEARMPDRAAGGTENRRLSVEATGG